MDDREEIVSSEDFEDIFAYFADDVDKSIWCGRGWADIIRRCHNELFAKDPYYRIIQIKEKFGSLRLYFTPSNMNIYPEMSSIVLKYETESSLTCDVCGLDGYISTLHTPARARCDEHREHLTPKAIPTYQGLDDSLPL